MPREYMEPSTPPIVRQFREILVWPIQLVPVSATGGPSHWESLKALSPEFGWQELRSPLDDPDFSASDYSEFVYFHPYIRRFLYGGGEQSVLSRRFTHAFSRQDVCFARVVLRPGQPPLDLEVSQIRLLLFDLDIALLVMELGTHDLLLTTAQDLLDRFRRAFPPYWEHDGQGGRCCALVQWLSADKQVLATSDFTEKEKYLEHVRTHRIPPLAAHWEWLLRPLTPAVSLESSGVLRYKQISDDRIPLMSYLAFDDPGILTRADFIRLAFAASAGASDQLPYAAQALQDFESLHCYDRFWAPQLDAVALSTRFLCSGYVFAMVGRNEGFFSDAQIGNLAHFRHHYLAIGILAHFSKTALLMLSDRLAMAVNMLDLDDPEARRIFRQDARLTLEKVLIFTHRYGFHEISSLTTATDLYHLWVERLNIDALFREVVQETQDISRYLDMDDQRKDSETSVHLTVVATFGLSVVLATGLLGMNVLDAADQPLLNKILLFLGTLVLCFIFVVITIRRSRWLSGWMADLANPAIHSGDRYHLLLRLKKQSPSPTSTDTKHP